jgi:hypothetical protein
MSERRRSLQPWWFELGIVYDADGSVVADNVGILDAPVIVAAPKLLDAVESCVAEIRRLGGGDVRTLERAEAAIAEAHDDPRKHGSRG